MIGEKRILNWKNTKLELEEAKKQVLAILEQPYHVY